MAEWHHRFSGHEFEQTLEDSEGQGSLACSMMIYFGQLNCCIAFYSIHIPQFVYSPTGDFLCLLQL